MCVRIHEAGQNNVLARVNDFAIGCDQCFNFTASAGSQDSPILDEHRAVFDGGKLAHFRANARARWSCKCDKLRTVDNGKLLAHTPFRKRVTSPAANDNRHEAVVITVASATSFSGSTSTRSMARTLGC